MTDTVKHISRGSRHKEQIIALGTVLLSLGPGAALASPLESERLGTADQNPSINPHGLLVSQAFNSIPSAPLEVSPSLGVVLQEDSGDSLSSRPALSQSDVRLLPASESRFSQSRDLETMAADSSESESNANDSVFECPNSDSSQESARIEALYGPDDSIDSQYASLIIKDITIHEFWRNTVLEAEIRNKIDEFREGFPRIEPSSLNRLTDEITDLYVEAGYINSRAYLAKNSDFERGVIVIAIVEGRVSNIEVDRQLPRRQLNLEYLCQRIRLGTGIPLNSRDLEDNLRLLRDNPLLDNVEATLSSSGTVGFSTLKVTTTESDPWELGVTLNNYSPPSVGGEQALINLQHRNLSGLGDSLQSSYTHRTLSGGNNRWQIGYQVPINALEGTLSFRTEINRSTIVQAPFDRFDIKANSEVYELGFRQPLWRSPREEFALSLGLTHRHGQTFLFNNLPTPFGQGPDSQGVSQVSVLQLGQDFVHRDPRGAWGMSSKLNFGLDLLGATENTAPIPDGQFFSWVGQFQRVQRLGQSHLAIVQTEVQLTPHTLLPSEQFVIGGGQNLPGYRQNVRSGDNGWRFSLEDRITLARNNAGVPTVQVIPMISIGGVWNTPGNPNRLLQQTGLSSASLGLWWSPVPQWSARLDYAVPFVNLVDRGENIQDHGLYFNLSYKR